MIPDNVRVRMAWRWERNGFLVLRGIGDPFISRFSNAMAGKTNAKIRKVLYRILHSTTRNSHNSLARFWFEAIARRTGREARTGPGREGGADFPM